MMDGLFPIRVMVADNHRILRSTLEAIIRAEPDLVLVAEASDGLEAVQAYIDYLPDVVLMDAEMPHMNRIEATRTLVQTFPQARIIVFSIYIDKEFSAAALEAGAVMFLDKAVAAEQLLPTIHQVSRLIPGAHLD
jgi:two-component system, NarL family, response regulator